MQKNLKGTAKKPQRKTKEDIKAQMAKNLID